MRIYLAARYGRYFEMQEVASRLRALGHTVTSRWIDGTHRFTGGETPDEMAALCRKWAHIDLDDLTSAQLVLSFTGDESHLSPSDRSRGGRHVEFGYALSLDLQDDDNMGGLWIVGPRENVFHYLSMVRQFDTLDEAIAALETA